VTTFRDGKRQDRQLLQGFRCTRPPAVDERGKRLPHNRPWETEVEGYFHVLRPPGRSEDMIRLGIDDNQDLASIVEVQRLKPISEYPIPEYFIRAMAVALTHRGRGGAVADAAMEDMLTELARRVAKSGVAQFIISGNIHELNKASQAMAERHGLRPLTDVAQDSYIRWRLLVEIGI
jgi:hypothetical protein